MTTARTYSTRRYAIVESIVELLKGINGSGQFLTNIHGQVFSKMKFFDDVNDFPCICVVASNEVREYQAGGYRDRFLDVRVMLYVKEDNPLAKCESLLEDIETLIESNGRLSYYDKQGVAQRTIDISVTSISTDEGTLDPISIGEMALRVHY